MLGSDDSSAAPARGAEGGALGPANEHHRDGDRIRVVLADGDPLSRRVVRDVLQACEDIVIAAEASDGVEALELTLHYKPDVLLTECVLARLDGIEVARAVTEQRSDVKVVMFTVDPTEEVAVRALRAGAAGVLSKQMPMGSLARAVSGVVDGEAAVSRHLTMRLIERVRSMPDRFTGMRPVKSPLTPREWEVLDLVSSGFTTQQIAERLVLTEDTVYSHVKNILRKLQVHSRREAIALAERMRRPDALAG